jgi:hypothetical protein
VRAVTDEQRRAISVIACLTLLHRRPPALRELASVLEKTHVAVIHRLHWLEKKGLWRRGDRRVTELGLRSVPGLDLLLGLLDRPAPR